MALEPASAASPDESSAARHDRVYTVLLIVLAFLCGLGMISIGFMSRNPKLAPESRWVFQMTACIYAALLAAMVVTLILRGVAPRAGRTATMALNIILLIVFPLGTALGIYGLIKVDKDRQPCGGGD
jgi:hypothetical protein